jgi:hypothetical protein
VRFNSHEKRFAFALLLLLLLRLLFATFDFQRSDIRYWLWTDDGDNPDEATKATSLVARRGPGLFGSGL